MISVYAYHMCLGLFLPVLSLLTCFISSLTRFADFVSNYYNNSSSDSKAFLHFVVFSGFPTAVHRPLHALRYYTVGIPFSTAHKRQSQTSKLHVHRGLIMHTNAHSHNTKCRTAGVLLFITAY